ncbi:MAG: hypothetical protein AAF740_12350 [Bacteroidota bacterium]
MRHITIFIVVISTVGLFSRCLSRNEPIIFSAFDDELYYIKLYEKSKFELLFNGVETTEGDYLLKGDTIILKYDDPESI